MASFDLTRADGEGTTCPQCTYINDDGEDSCEVCGAALEGASSGDDVDRDEAPSSKHIDKGRAEEYVQLELALEASREHTAESEQAEVVAAGLW